MFVLTEILFILVLFFISGFVIGDAIILPRANIAALAVDPQKTFVLGGSLAIDDTGAEWVNKVVDFTRKIKIDYKVLVVGTQDFHPRGHISFLSSHSSPDELYQSYNLTKVSEEEPELFKPSLFRREITTGDGIKLYEDVEQIMWPEHGVKGGGDVERPDGTKVYIGTDFFDGVSEHFDYIQQKGTNVLVDSYSAFNDDGGFDTGLNAYLISKNIKTLIVYGLAGDVCVKVTIEHAIRLGYNIVFVEELTR